MRILAAVVAFVGVFLAFYLPGDFNERTPMRMAIALGALAVAVALEVIATRRLRNRPRAPSGVA
ncbi:MAG TPA: hypothetical protein VJ979_02565 [Actinomycetota bacterium]|nr:hypothetical protein [Actinomycetota bacterium]